MGVHDSHEAGCRNVDAEDAKMEDMEVFCAD
jgi:hypothetical protein